MQHLQASSFPQAATPSNSSPFKSPILIKPWGDEITYGGQWSLPGLSPKFDGTRGELIQR